MFLSDNGASREGEAAGTTAYFRTPRVEERERHRGPEFDRERIDLAGGPRTLVHYPRGWAMASNTPFRLYKINTHAGGHSVPFILHWPSAASRSRADAPVGAVTDLLPTLCELAGVDRPAGRGGVVLQPLDGVSLGPVLADPWRRTTRRPSTPRWPATAGFYDDGWEIVTRHQPLMRPRGRLRPRRPPGG